MGNFMKNYLFGGNDISRIHISHNDLDGYACRVVMNANNLYRCVCCPEKVIHIDAGQKNIEDTLENVLCGHNSGTMVLITDLSVNPKVFEMYPEVEFCVVDHHKSSLPYAIPEEYANVTYMVTVNTCGALLLYNIVSYTMRGHYRDPGKMIKHNHAMGDLRHYLGRVNKYDLGKWGSWDVPCWESVSPDVKENLTFSAYRIHDSIDRYSLDKAAQLLSIRDESSDFGVIAEELWNNLKTEYSKLSERIEIYDLGIDPARSFDAHGQVWGMQFPPAKVISYTAEKKEDQISGNFSLFAREYLTANPDIKLFIYFDYVNGVVSLRSTDSGYDCCEIAMLNGGRGHHNSAGFPVPTMK